MANVPILYPVWVSGVAAIPAGIYLFKVNKGSKKNKVYNPFEHTSMVDFEKVNVDWDSSNPVDT